MRNSVPLTEVKIRAVEVMAVQVSLIAEGHKDGRAP